MSLASHFRRRRFALLALAGLAAVSPGAIVDAATGQARLETPAPQTAPPRTPAPRPAASAPAARQPAPFPGLDPGVLRELRWRSIGPYRGGRTRAVAGVPSQPNVFYIGVVNGGVWKTTDFGRTWEPIFDDQPTGSIGAVAVAPSNPNIVYVGSGEGLQRPDLSTGDGIYKSDDAGRTWIHLGLRDGQQVPQIVVDPRSPDRLFVAVLGHPYGPNEERGIFRSLDGGRTFEKVLYKDENTGGADVELDAADPDVVYATLWEARQGPWENAAWSGTAGGMFKSTDGGRTWRQLKDGLPDDGVIQANIAISPSDAQRLYATVATSRGVGIFRSDDAGEHWARCTTDARPAARIGGGDLPVLAVDPRNADVVFSAAVVMWKSTDGGKTWTGIRGAPGGDDYQQLWINPDTPDTILAASDQGAIITVNGGETWSSWYNQPTAQVYHVATDNAFPYRVCSGQQESGSACVSSRGDHGQITVRDWQIVGVDEYGYAAPDPLDPDIVYGGRGVTRFDRRTGQTATVGPRPVRSDDFRVLRTAPLIFSPLDPRLLFFASNTVWKTSTGGRSWTQISPDLTRKTWEVPASVGKYRSADSARPTQRGVVYTVAPSYVDPNSIWAGTDDGLIHVTTDGGTSWKDVTPAELKPWMKVSLIDAGRFDPLTAYAAINTIRLDDLRPHIYRTHDGGRTWTHITNGIPDGGTINVVREDPARRGLLFAGSEREVYVSFDDGDHWQSLRLNMPASSVRDLVVKNDDLVVGTHGRGFWILDDITPLRQIEPAVLSAAAWLFKPETAYRVRFNMNTDTPLPADEPAGANPPDGAVIDYWLSRETRGPVVLEIADASGTRVRRFASDDPVEEIDPNLAVPRYWVRPPQALSAASGLHRFVWDLHWTPVPGVRANYPIAATPHDTAPSPTSPWVVPGSYRVTLTANGAASTRTLIVKMDPRVKTTAAGLSEQFTQSKTVYDGMLEANAALRQLRDVRAQVRERRDGLTGAAAATGGSIAQALTGFDEKLTALEGGGGGFGPFGGGLPDTLAGISSALTQLHNLLQAADVAPTRQLVAAVADRRKMLGGVMARWTAIRDTDLALLNQQLAQAGVAAIAAR